MKFVSLLLLAISILFSGACSTKKKKSSNPAPAAESEDLDSDDVGKDKGERRIDKVDSDKDDAPGDEVEKPKISGAVGCIQGVLIDGLAKTPVNEAEVYVHVSGVVVKSEEVSDIGGEYSLCGVPVDERFPIFAKKEGYLLFQGYIKIDSSVASGTAGAQADIEKPSPTAIGNIHLYPLGNANADFVFSITDISAAATNVTGAKVIMQASGRHLGDSVGANADNLIVGHGIYTEAIEVTSDAGVATFAAADLALGAEYQYQIIPPEGSKAAIARGMIVVGGIVGNQTGAYDMEIALSEVAGDLVILDTTFAEGVALGASPAIIITFNRDVSVNAANIVATLANFGDAITTANYTATAAGNILTLNALFTDGTNNITPTEAGSPLATITFTTVNVQTVGAVNPKTINLGAVGGLLEGALRLFN